MRKEATLDEWKNLYEVTTKIKGLEPWNTFWDMDLIAVRDGQEEDTIFFSILGKGGSCYGISVYEGFDGLNDFMMLTMQDKLNLSGLYAMYCQNNLTCYWGNREELTNAQRKIIKDLGYKYRGRDQWLYFLSMAKGYTPYNLNQKEVRKMTKYLERLLEAVEYYYENSMAVDFEHGNMFVWKYDKKEDKWCGCEEKLPFVTYQFQNLVITDNELLEELRRTPVNRHILEADIEYPGVRISDKKYERPVNPAFCLLGESKTGMIIKADMADVNEDPNILLTENIVEFIMRYGRPKEIRVSNVLVEAILEQLCEETGIKLRRVRVLYGLKEFIEGFKRMQ